MTQELVKFDLAGRELEGVPDPEAPGAGWVVVRRVCGRLGLSNQVQQRKLNQAKWASVTIMVMVAEDGKNRTVFCLSARSVPMWLATIQASRCKPEVRPVLEKFQCCSAEVLAKVFIDGQRPLSAEERAELRMLREQLDRQAALLEQQAQALATMQHLLLAANQGVVTPQQSAGILCAVKRIGALRGAAGCFERKASGARRAVMNKLQACSAWSGRGCRWAHLPAMKYGVVLAKLEELEHEAVRAIKLKCADRQEVLPFQRPS